MDEELAALGPPVAARSLCMTRHLRKGQIPLSTSPVIPALAPSSPHLPDLTVLLLHPPCGACGLLLAREGMLPAPRSVSLEAKPTKAIPAA